MHKNILTVVGITILFLGTCITPSVAINNPIKPISTGNTLYVGGTGPGNYTTIQDAIDNSSDRDTVFVYSGVYNEGVITVKKSIKIIGEDKNSTIIDGNGYWCVFVFSSDGKDNVKLSGFTIKNARQWNKGAAGIHVYTNNHIISNNIIHNNVWVGIRLDHSSNNKIINNIFTDNANSDALGDKAGILGWSSNYNIIEGNVLDNNSNGILLSGNFNKISNNIIKNSNEIGIFVKKIGNKIVTNHIENNDIGVMLSWAYITYINKNNIFNNNINGYFIKPGINFWKKNYWGGEYMMPKIISGILQIPIGWPQYPGQDVKVVNISWINIDWNPVKEPYYI